MSSGDEQQAPRRVGFPAGVPAWIDNDAPDVQAAARFYEGLFGWRFEERTPPGAAGPYLVALLGDDEVAAIGSVVPDSGRRPSWVTHVSVADADATTDLIRTAGGMVLSGPIDAGELARVALCADPAGAPFGVWQAGTIKGAQTVNAPNSWNFSELNAHKLRAVLPFYAQVFGWQVDQPEDSAAVDAGNGAMVRLPGYADFLEQFDPGIRQRHSDFGAPPGFSDCVAWILPLPASETPYWSVTFSVDDADHAAERARTLGGTVEVAPFNVAPTRLAVLRDPAGARFTVSAFNPG